MKAVSYSKVEPATMKDDGIIAEKVNVRIDRVQTIEYTYGTEQRFRREEDNLVSIEIPADKLHEVIRAVLAAREVEG